MNIGKSLQAIVIGSALVVGHSISLRIADAQGLDLPQPETMTKGFKNSPKWSVPLILEFDDTGSKVTTDKPTTHYYTSYPGHAEDSWFKGPADCQIVKMRIPSSHVGFHNGSNNKIGLVVQIPRGNDPVRFQTVILGPGEFATVECEGCKDAAAIVPKGAQPTADDFRVTLVLGQIYDSRYDSAKKRWEIAQRSDQ